MGEITARPATVADLDAICAIVAAGFESYREFLPDGWEPPPAGEERESVAVRLADPQTWIRVACADAEIAGHLGWRQARVRRAADTPTGPEPPAVSGVAHLWQLFVAPRWWGRGVADHLHGLGIEAMAAQGYGTARLFTPALHARARRFYENRGWSVTEEDFNPYLGIDIVEYRRPL